MNIGVGSGIAVAAIWLSVAAIMIFAPVPAQVILPLSVAAVCGTLFCVD